VIAQLSEGFLLGLATGTTCLATCGPVYAPYLMQYDRSLWQSLLALVEISGGRFVTYLLVGAAAGYLGSGLPLDNREWFTASAYILFSVFLLVSTFRTHQKERCCKAGKWSSFADRPFILGLLTGINFCPSFLIALTKAVSLSGPFAGMAVFAAFFAGTSLFLIPLSFVGVFGMKKIFRVIARWSAIIISIWFFVQAGIAVHRQLEKPKSADIDPALIINLLDSTKATILASDTITQKNLRDSLVTRKKSAVAIVTSGADLPEKGVIFIGQERVAGEHLETHPLRRAGRFVVILPDSSRHQLAAPEISSILEFLKFYSFKIDPDSGSIFQIPESILHK
jgi:sulfite exporter TauE/SafE